MTVSCAPVETADCLFSAAWVQNVWHVALEGIQSGFAADSRLGFVWLATGAACPRGSQHADQVEHLRAGARIYFPGGGFFIAWGWLCGAGDGVYDDHPARHVSAECSGGLVLLEQLLGCLGHQTG